MKHATSASCVVIAAIVLFGFVAAFGQNTDSQTVTAKDAFALLKNLAGEWNGTIQEKDKGPAGSVIYKLTAGGNVVTETLFPGSEHEMVTVYYLKGDQLMLTHYCASGNHPQMALDKQSTKNTLVFTFAGAANFNPNKDVHMHGARIKLVDNDHLESEWDSYKDGKSTDAPAKFFLERKKS
jgi:hypothetical protein